MNKVAFNIFLFVCGFLVIVAGLGLTMIIAPGADILGVRYIRSTSGSYHERQSVYCAESGVQEFNINCDNIPINIVFVQSYTFSVDMNEEYNGFTKTVENPDLAVEDAGSKITFAVQEYVPFIYHNRMTDSALTISIPIYYSGRVAVQSRNSKVVVDGLNGTLGELIISTGGKVEVNDVAIPKLHLNLGSGRATINTGAKIGELSIESESANISVLENIDGKITYKANSGSLNFKSCKELEVDATSAKVGSTGEELAKVNGEASIKTNSKVVLEIFGNTKIESSNGDIVLGNESINYACNVEIETKKGDVTLKGVRGGNVTVTTKSGDVKAETLSTFDIKTEYGYVKIDSCSNGTIKSGSGNVYVKQALSEISVDTRSGDVILGDSENVFATNVNVVTVGGNVSILNGIDGEVSIKTKSGDVSFSGSAQNNSSIFVSSTKGNVYGENLAGNVKVATYGSVTLQMINLSNGVEIKAKDKAVTIISENQNLGYNLKTNKAKNIEVYGEIIKDKNYLTDINANVNIYTSKGKIIITDKAEEK